MSTTPGQIKFDTRKKRLQKLYNQMGSEAQHMLLEFAEFLAQRYEPDIQEIGKPEIIPRPESETVVKAIQRLSASYSMLDKSLILNETSELMTQHIMQGRDAVEVIDELEKLFVDHYQKLIAQNLDNNND